MNRAECSVLTCVAGYLTLLQNDLNTQLFYQTNEMLCSTVFTPGSVLGFIVRFNLVISAQ